MVLYIGIYVIFCLAYAFVRSEFAKKATFLIMMPAMILFAGTRDWVGCDFYGYLKRFERYQFYSFEEYGSNADFGFTLLNYFVSGLGLDYMWVNLFCALIFFVCLTLFALRRENPLGLLALFFPILIVQLAMSGIRQATATAILLLAWNAFVDGKRFRVLAWILIAGTFHSTAIIFLPMFFLVNRTFAAWKLLLASIVIAPLALLFAGEQVTVYQQRYIEGDVQSLGALFRLGLIVITVAMFEMYRTGFKEKYPEDYELMRAFSLFSIGLVVVFFVSTLVAHRLAYYVTPVQLLILMRLPIVVNERYRSALISSGPYLVYGLYMLVWFGTSRHADICYVPYDSYLF